MTTNKKQHALIGILGSLALASAGAAHAATASYMWSRSAGHIVDDNVAAVATNAGGDVFVGGNFVGAISLGGDSLITFYDFGSITLSTQDIFLARYDAVGNHIWSKQFGGVDGYDETLNGLVADPSGNLVAAGRFLNGTPDLGGGPLTTGSLFIAKYDGAGNYIWSLSTGLRSGQSFGWLTGVACDASGNIYVCGYFQGTLNIGGVNLVSVGSYDMFVAKYSSAGAFQWALRFGDNAADTANRVAVDGSGNVILTGRVGGAVNLGGGSLTYLGGGADVFLLKLSPAGAHVWSKDLGGYSSDTGYGLAVTAANDIILTGEFSSVANFGGSSFVAYGTVPDVFLARYDSGGNHVWSKAFTGEAIDRGASVAVDAAGHIALTGYFGYYVGTSGYTIDIDGTTLTSSGEADGFLARFTPGGTLEWATGFGGSLYDSGDVLAMDPVGDVVFGGSFRQSIHFLNVTHTSRGYQDFVFGKFAAPAAEPAILSVSDVGNDQGRQVRIGFQRSGMDGPGRSVPVLRYDAYRRDDAPPAPSSNAPGARRTLDEGWQYVASIPAHGESEYLMRAPTLGDSSAAGAYRSTFFVRAVTEDVYSFYDSPADSGYSVDDLAPAVPANLIYNAGMLSWDPSAADDFDHFTVYGADSDAFAAATVVDVTTSHAMDVMDSPYAFYFVTATDLSGNEGQPAALNAPNPSNHAPRRYVLSVANFPNPFNPRTTVSYTVPSRGAVTVAVYDARGARVATLVDNESREAGAYRVEWNGRTDAGTAVSSGIYFARMLYNDTVLSKKMVLLK